MKPKRREGATSGRLGVANLSAAAGQRPSVGVLAGEDDVAATEQKIVQDAVNQLATAGGTVHGELINATEHDIANIIVQRAKDIRADIIILGHQQHHESVVADHVIRQHPNCSVLLDSPPRPPAR